MQNPPRTVQATHPTARLKTLDGGPLASDSIGGPAVASPRPRRSFGSARVASTRSSNPSAETFGGSINRPRIGVAGSPAAEPVNAASCPLAQRSFPLVWTVRRSATRCTERPKEEGSHHNSTMNNHSTITERAWQRNSPTPENVGMMASIPVGKD